MNFIEIAVSEREVFAFCPDSVASVELTLGDEEHDQDSIINVHLKQGHDIVIYFPTQKPAAEAYRQLVQGEVSHD